MAAQKQSQADIETAEFKRKIKKDITTVQAQADLLAGITEVDDSRILKGKKVTSKKPTIDQPTNLPRFLDFMEENYKNSMIKVQLKKRI